MLSNNTLKPITILLSGNTVGMALVGFFMKNLKYYITDKKVPEWHWNKV